MLETGCELCFIINTELSRFYKYHYVYSTDIHSRPEHIMPA